MSSCAICHDTRGPVVHTSYLTGLFGSIMAYLLSAFQMPLRRRQPAHPLSPLAARHVVNQISFYRYVPSSDRPSTSIAPDLWPLSVTPNPLFVAPHAFISPHCPATSIWKHRVPTSTAEELENFTARLHMENAVLRRSCPAWDAHATYARRHPPRAERIVASSTRLNAWTKRRARRALSEV